MKNILAVFIMFFPMPSLTFPNITQMSKDDALGVIACFEKLGNSMPLFFDEEGLCPKSASQAQTSIWLNKSDNDTIKFTRFFRVQGEGDQSTWLINFDLHVEFEHKNKSCSFTFYASHSDEDAFIRINKGIFCN